MDGQPGDEDQSRSDLPSLATHTTPQVLLVNRQLAPAEMTPGRDHDYHALRREVMDDTVPCTCETRVRSSSTV